MLYVVKGTFFKKLKNKNKKERCDPKKWKKRESEIEIKIACKNQILLYSL